jgi:putative hydrolase of the HAD superfamily
MPQDPMSNEPRKGLQSIRAVILDYGEVVTRRPTAEEFGRMAEMLNVTFDMFYKLWEASRGPYDRGDFTAQEYWLKFAAEVSASIDTTQIEILRKIEVEIWAHPNPDMLHWVSQLRAAGIKTALLSNMPWDLVKHVRTNFLWMENFSFITLSAEVGLIKPDSAIYEHTLQGLGVAASEALFIDDREINVQAARALGIRGLQFRSIAELKHDLEALAFPISPLVANHFSPR